MYLLAFCSARGVECNRRGTREEVVASTRSFPSISVLQNGDLAGNAQSLLPFLLMGRGVFSIAGELAGAHERLLKT